MWREIGDWFCALLITAAVAVSVAGAADVLNGRTPPSTVPATAEACTVVVDAGHGGFDGGAVGTTTGTPEAGLNLAVAGLLKARLTQAGLQVIMTREDEEALGATKNQDMAARGRILKQSGVDLVVSIHMNKFTDSTVSGPMAYYMAGSEEGQKLAQCVINSLCDGLERPRRLANPGDYFVIRECACPSVLVECGFLSNKDDEEKLLDPVYQAKIAAAVSSGILSYLQGAGGEL